MIKGYLALLTIVTLVISINTLATEDSNDIEFKKLINAKTLKFIPQQSCTVNWEKDKPELIVDNEVTEKESPNIIFDSIDSKKRTARCIGNIGITDVVIIPTVAGITFIEQPELGNLNITTVFFSCVNGTENYKAVHSRHVDIFSIPIPSQQYGICKILETDYLKTKPQEELLMSETVKSENIHFSSDEVTFTGIPSIKILNENGKNSSPEKLPQDKAIEYKCSITKKGDKYYWNTRENVELIPAQSGIYTTYMAINGSGYIRIIDPEAKKALFKDEELPYNYMEHLLLGLSTITYYGETTKASSSVEK
jgi:hypothetical protein